MRFTSPAGQAAKIIAACACSAALITACSTSSSSKPGLPPATPSAHSTVTVSPDATASHTAAPGGAAPTSCNVVTQAEASVALGQTVKPPIFGRAVVEGGVACVFYGPHVPPGTSPDIAVADSVRVVLVTGPDAKKWFGNYRSKVHAQTIHGLGDEAYYDGYASINVLKGDAYVRIAVGVASNLGPEETLARDALGRM